MICFSFLLFSNPENELSIEGTMVQSHLPPFQNLGSFVHPTFACLSEEPLKAGGPFFLVSMPGEVKNPTQGGKCVTCSGVTNSREGQL